MNRVETTLDGPFLIEPAVFSDERGFFAETFRANAFDELGVPGPMVQHNQSRSTRGTIRGMHFQTGAGVAKVVRCARGRILDVLVDIRPTSPHFGSWEAFELDDVHMRMLFVPVGFAHGFCVLSKVADVVYLQSTYYSPEVEAGFSPLDPDVAIPWPVSETEMVVSERDRQAPGLAEIRPVLS